MKKFLEKVVYLVISIKQKINIKFGLKFWKKILNLNVKALDKHSDFFLCYSFKPKKTEKVNLINCSVSNISSNVSIILQGPVNGIEGFVLDTIKYYRKMYPNVLIVVSTWKGCKKEFANALTKFGAVLIESELPTVSGMGNVNYQTVSTQAGIDYSIAKKSEYCLKTRTDQRIYKPFFLEFLLSLCELDDKDRLVLLDGSVGGTLLIPYFLSDFLCFGSSTLVRQYFNLPIQTNFNFSSKLERRKYMDCLIKENISIYEFYKKTAPEIAYCRNFLELQGFYPKDTIEGYWESMKNYFVCISQREIGLLWLKERHIDETELFGEFGMNDSDYKLLSYNCDFATWLSIYNGFIKYNSKLEEYINTPVKVYFNKELKK